MNEIPIEVRKMIGETKPLIRKYLTKCGCIFLSTNFLLCVAYHHMIHKIKPAVARIHEKAITTILCVSYVLRRPVKYATNEIESKNNKFNHIKVMLASLMCSKVLW
jgi:hypothetical protein